LPTTSLAKSLRQWVPISSLEGRLSAGQTGCCLARPGGGFLRVGHQLQLRHAPGGIGQPAVVLVLCGEFAAFGVVGGEFVQLVGRRLLMNAAINCCKA
jgi:hypothetical protein